MLQDTKSGDRSPHSKVLRNITFALLLFALVGCSRDGRLAASGTVTLDGKPLESGAITFKPAPGSEGHSAGESLENGQFQLAGTWGFKPGKYFVTIQSFADRPHGCGPAHRSRAGLVKYKEANKLEATLAAGATNHFDFRLTSAADGVR